MGLALRNCSIPTARLKETSPKANSFHGDLLRDRTGKGHALCNGSLQARRCLIDMGAFSTYHASMRQENCAAAKSQPTCDMLMLANDSMALSKARGAKTDVRNLDVCQRKTPIGTVPRGTETRTNEKRSKPLFLLTPWANSLCAGDVEVLNTLVCSSSSLHVHSKK